MPREIRFRGDRPLVQMKNRRVPFLNQIWQRSAVADEMYGIELELEGAGVQIGAGAVKGWKQKGDGSLRGESVEWIFNGPASFEESKKRVTRLFEAFEKYGTKMKKSIAGRTSTHIHVNFNGRTVKDIVKFFCAHTVVEELLESYCGEEREGNLFCLSTRDAEAIVDMVEEAISKRYSFDSFHDEMRYCAFNLNALNRFGSIEIRTMPQANSAEEVINWLEIIREVYLFSVNKMDTPARFCEQLSLKGSALFLSEIFSPDVLQKLMKAFIPKDLRTSLYEGIRLIQPFAYKIDEDFSAEYIPPEIPKVKGIRIWQEAFEFDQENCPEGKPYKHLYTGDWYSADRVIEWERGLRNLPGDPEFKVVGDILNEPRPPKPHGDPPKEDQCYVYHPKDRHWYFAPSDPEDDDEVPGCPHIRYRAEQEQYYDFDEDCLLEWE